MIMSVDLIAELRNLIGVPPAGFAFLEYILAGFLVIFLVYSACSIISMIFKWIGGF